MIPMFMFWHSIIFVKRKSYIKALMYFELPLLWILMIFNYIVNINSLMTDIFGHTVFDNPNYRRFGVWVFEVPFPHFLLQTFTLFYGSFVCYLFREYDKLQIRLALAKEKKMRRKRAKKERLQQRERSSSVRSRASQSLNASFVSRMDVPKEDPIYTYEILFRLIVKNLDLILMAILYIAGVNRIDIFHVILLIIFVLFIMYPDWFRRNFIYILYFMIIVTTIKYIYVLLEPEFNQNPKAKRWFIVLGLNADIEDRIYGRNNLFNNNYLIILLGYIQYTIYTSDYSKNAFSPEQAEKDKKAFANRFPRLTTFLVIMVESIRMMIPWITYLVFFIINIINTKNLINFVLLMLSLILLFWHISADLITKVSHRRLTNGWRCFTFVAAFFFFVILFFQLGSIEEIAELESTQNLIDWLPIIIKENHDIIGLESYLGLTKFQLMVKFLAYVAFLNLSVITQRQLERSADRVKAYENKRRNNAEPLGSRSSSGGSGEIMKVKFSLVYVVHKLQILWPAFTTISWNTFTLLSLTISGLAIHWRLSVASLVYLFMLMIYYILTPFFLQPNIRDSGLKHKAGLTVKEIKELWAIEDKRAKQKVTSLRNQFVVFIAFFTIICIGILHLSANFTILADRYRESSGELWESLTFITFWAGVNYTKMYAGNTYFDEIWGYILILLFCVIERKAQIWLTSKFGYEGSIYESYPGIIKLEDYKGEESIAKKISEIISTPLEEIKEEDEFLRESLMKSSGNLDKNNDPDDKELTPEQLFEKEKAERVRGILTLEYKLFIAKTFRVIIFVIVILMALLSSFYKSNIWGIIMLLITAIFSFSSVKFKNLKWFTI